MRVQVPGISGPTEVITGARLLPVSDPSASTVVLFEGDQVDDDDTRDLLGPERWSPECHLSSLVSRFSRDAQVLVVMPTSLAPGGQACYGNFLPALTATGEPLGFRPQGYPAATHLAALLATCSPERPAGQQQPLTLVGFSKGAVVLNQLLAEMARREETLPDRGLDLGERSPLDPQQLRPQQQQHQDLLQSADTDGGIQSDRPVSCRAPSVQTGPIKPDAPEATAAVGEPQAAAAARPPPPAQDDATAAAAAVLDQIGVAHFLDAGLNCRGVHLPDPAVVAQLGRRHRRRPLAVCLHGTPRQWGDRKRPWVAAERDRFVALLQQAGVPVVVRKYFEGQPPSLRQHFDIISRMNPDVDEGKP